MEDDEGVCFGSCALAAAAQAVLLIRWLLSQAAAAACTGDQEVGAALPAAQSRATPEAAQQSQAPPAQPQLLSLPPTPTTTCALVFELADLGFQCSGTVAILRRCFCGLVRHLGGETMGEDP